MEQIVELLEGHIGRWASFYLMGPSSHAVGGRIVNVTAQYIELEQQEGMFAYVPLERIAYITLQKPKEPVVEAPPVQTEAAPAAK